jgi:hypothetical protein
VNLQLDHFPMIKKTKKQKPASEEPSTAPRGASKTPKLYVFAA